MFVNNIYYVTHIILFSAFWMQETHEFQVFFVIIQNQIIGIAGNSES